LRFILIALSAILVAILPALPAHAACDGREITRHVANAPLCIPEKPQRIVVLDTLYTLGMSMELGAPVVGAPLFAMEDKRLEAMARAGKVEDIGHSTQPSPERIIALKPDLILGDAVIHGRAYELAAQVAPTVLVDVQNWRDYYATVAEVTGRKGAADEAFKTYETRAAEIRKKVPDIKVSVVRIIPGGFQVYMDGPGAYAPFSVLHDAGVRRTAYETATDGTVLKRPDWEGLAALDGDVLLYIVGGAHHNDAQGKLEAETLANPLWQMLPAVKAGRAYRVDPVTWMEFSGLASANRILDDVERTIVKRP
jgi:iron complex transport system substrate-binding protein